MLDTWEYVVTWIMKGYRTNGVPGNMGYLELQGTWNYGVHGYMGFLGEWSVERRMVEY